MGGNGEDIINQKNENKNETNMYYVSSESSADSNQET